jgi:hypothetical protein
MERQSAVTHTLPHTKMAHITRQLGYKDTFCQNVVTAKKLLVLIFCYTVPVLTVNICSP